MVVVPAYNEEDTIKEVIEKSLSYCDVCVIDDGSTDNTLEILKNLERQYQKKLHIIQHKKNTHIPLAIQDGMKYAIEKKYRFVITMDAGMSHLPSEIVGFLSSDEEADLVIGSRKKKKNVPIYRRWISWSAAIILNYILSKNVFDLFGPKISDCTSGYRRYSKKAFTWIANSKLNSVSFDFHMEALYLIHQKGGKIVETEIHYEFSNSSFNLTVLKQSLKFTFHLLKKKLFGT